MTPMLAPSLLSANFGDLRTEMRTIEEAGASYLHFDVMDGVFVPNISFGAPVLKSIRPLTKMIFDVHLMITKPQSYVCAFADSGADILNIHLEADCDPAVCVRTVRKLGKKAAITLKPGTPAEEAFTFLSDVDMVLVMSVEPGFGGQSFQSESLRKVEKLANEITRLGLQTAIEIDGGIHLRNVRQALDAGADVIVAGSAVFGRTPEETAAQVRGFMEILEAAGQ